MVGPDDLLIATSFRPYAQQTADIVNDAVERQARVIAISDSRLSPIARRADLCFEVKDAEFRKFRSLTASLCIAQTLVIGYAFQLTERESGTPRA
jgi:DNA-binding MurR/RpiR family transcriptional regulator